MSNNSHSGTIGRTRGISVNGQVRRQRSIEWQKERRYSSSEEDIALPSSASAGGGGSIQQSRRNNFTDGPSADSSILAQLIAQTQQLTSKYDIPTQLNLEHIHFFSSFVFVCLISHMMMIIRLLLVIYTQFTQ